MGKLGYRHKIGGSILCKNIKNRIFDNTMVKDFYKKIIQFFEKDIWKISTKDKHPFFGFLVKQGRILFIAVRGFNKDKIQLRASALSFYTLLSIVPVLAMVFGISQGFGLGDYVKDVLKERLHEHQDMLNVLLDFVDKYLSRINGGFITGMGMIILFWSVLKVLGNIESSFNNIWQVKKTRVIARQFTDYISLLVIAPVFLVVASSVNVAKLESISESVPFLQYLDSVVRITAAVISYTLIWVVFTLVYIIIPNTKVRFVPALIAGIIAGTMFQLLQWGYVNFQSLLSGYGAIYGTFAALPLFMMWLELSWLIVLVGAEISFAYQNASQYEQEAEDLDVSLKQRRVLVLLVARKIISNFIQCAPPLKATDLSQQLGIPVRVVRDLLYDLLNARIIIETLTHEVREVAYQPALDPLKITVSYVIDALDRVGQQLSLQNNTMELDTIRQIVDSFYNDLRKSPSNAVLKDIGQS
jgi:membrane protein